MRWLILLLLLVVGCDSPYEVARDNELTLSTAGELVGTLPDGREVRRYAIAQVDEHPHWIYVVGKSVTSNRAECVGRASHIRTEATIDQ